LITYNVNTPNLDLNLAHADIYHPRFIKLRLDQAGTAMAPRSVARSAPGAFLNLPGGSDLLGRTASFPILPAGESR
jgi:hypothetical protein